jgi:hypothetical protein
MDSQSIDHVKHIANTEVVRRLLIKYFMDKGFVESFDRQVYPAAVQDLPMVIPVLGTKLEVVPHTEELDNIQGKVVLGWNMFVLGGSRMYLGETHHNNIPELSRLVAAGSMVALEGSGTARRQTTPRKIITFITRVLESHEGGYVDLKPSRMPQNPLQQQPYEVKNSLMGMPQQFMTRSGYGV